MPYIHCYYKVNHTNKQIKIKLEKRRKMLVTRNFFNLFRLQTVEEAGMAILFGFHMYT